MQSLKETIHSAWQTLKKGIALFGIRKEERWLVLALFVLILALNALSVAVYFDRFAPLADNYHKLFVNTFHVSGYDPLTYEVVSKWATAYNIHRHPLLPFFMYVPYLINQALIWLTGVNCVQFVVGAIIVLSSVYAFLFLYRTLREVVELSRGDATLLALLGWSFGYILVASVVPDHFIISTFLLTLTLYIAGKMMKKGRNMSIGETILLFVFTAGVSLNNGIKTFIANFFTRQKRFFRPANLIFAIILPAILIWLFARWEYRIYEYPKWKARREMRINMTKKQREKVYLMVKDTTSLTDDKEIRKQARAIWHKQRQEKLRKRNRKPMYSHQGQPIKKTEFWNWTDITTPRTATIVENLFGESIILHQDNLLGDTLRGRPVIVKYRWWVNYIAETLLVILLMGGIWFGRRKLFMWLCLSWFAYDMLLHLVLGFGINEIYIMSPHWLFVFPLCIGYLIKSLEGRHLAVARCTIGALFAYLIIYNVTLIVEYFVM